MAIDHSTSPATTSSHPDGNRADGIDARSWLGVGSRSATAIQVHRHFADQHQYQTTGKPGFKTGSRIMTFALKYYF